MRKFFELSLSACLLFAVSACSSELESERDDFHLRGMIVRVEQIGAEHPRILVHYDWTLNGGTGSVWLFINDGTEILELEGTSLHRIGSDALEVGQQVRGWSSEVWLYSNPPQAGAVRIVIER